LTPVILGHLRINFVSRVKVEWNFSTVIK